MDTEITIGMANTEQNLFYNAHYRPNLHRVFSILDCYLIDSRRLQREAT
jgi:hypothetical protein